MRWTRRYRYCGLVLLGVALLISLATGVPQAQAVVEQAKRADTFVDSIGVATHLRYTDTTYGRYGDIIKPRLQELGVRHIRDGGKNADFYSKLNDLAKIGIKSTLVMDSRDGITASNVVKDVIQRVTASIEAAEGPNEWDVQSQLQYRGNAFPEGVRQYQTDLYNAIKADAATAQIEVLMPSLAFPENGSRLGYLSALDRGNMHSYAGGNIPSQDLDSKWIPKTQIVAGTDKPIIATECGWHNALRDPDASQPGISEQAGGRYVPRLFLEYFNRGIQRTFIYELINERRGSTDQEDNFGLLRSDGSPKPAFTALKNLIALLKDPGASFQPGRLAYSLSGNLNRVNHTLLQKQDGRFYLILWQEVPSFSLSSKRDLSPEARSISLTLSTAIRRAVGYYPTNSATSAWQTDEPTQLRLNVPDHPLVIELTPA